MGSMNHRERVLRALNHQEPDRVPIDFGSTSATIIVSEAYERLKRYLRIDAETQFLDKTSSRVSPSEEILRRFDIDTRMLPSQPTVTHSIGMELPSSYVDQWGVIWQLTGDGRYYAVKPPFAGELSFSRLRTHRWPDPDDPKLTMGLRERGQELRAKTDCAIVLGLPARVFSLGQNLCGLEDWLINLAASPDLAAALLDASVEIEAQMLRNILAAAADNVDVVFVAEDLGMQSAPLISPELYRRVIKPRHRKLFDLIKSHTSAKLLLHSDGAIVPFIGDLIDVGVDVLNPVQVSAAGMSDTRWLKHEFGKHIAFWGAIDTHHVLPFGTPAEVRAEVKRRIEDLAAGGGYVLASVHNIQAEVPPENICTMLEVAKEYGA